MSNGWPVADLDPVRRMRVMAAAAPAMVLAERFVDLPYDRVWAEAADLERSMPLLVTDFRSARLDGPQLSARGYLGQRARFDVVLEPGWCWMQSRFLIGGIAAVPENGGTRLAFGGGVRSRVGRPIVRLTGGLAARSLRRFENRLRS